LFQPRLDGIARLIGKPERAPDAARLQEQVGSGFDIGVLVAADQDVGHGTGFRGWVRGSSSAAAGVELETSWKRVCRWRGRASRATMRTATTPASAAEVTVI